MDAAVKKLIHFIEHPTTLNEPRETAISELNLLGISTDEIEKEAYSFWQNYFAENMTDILQNRVVLISHLLPDSILKQCFDNAFQEFQERKKQLGIDITKFWAP